LASSRALGILAVLWRSTLSTTALRRAPIADPAAHPSPLPRDRSETRPASMN